MFSMLFIAIQEIYEIITAVSSHDCLRTNLHCLQAMEMVVFKKILVLVCLLNTISFTTASIVINFERDWNITVQGVTNEDKKLGKDNTATYVECDDISNTERRCVLTYEFLHPDGFIFKNKCLLSFRSDKGVHGVNVMKIRTAKRGKVVISYIEEQERKELSWAAAYTTYRVIDTTTCKFYEGKVLFNTSQLNEELGDTFWEGNVYLYEDGTFDTFLAQKDLCDGARCKVTFGSDGQMIGKPSSYLSSKMFAKDIKIFPLTEDDISDDFFAVVTDLKKNSEENGPTALKLLSQIGTSNTPNTLLDLSNVVAFDVDHTHGVLGICWSKRKANNITIIECRQYNIINIATVSATFELPYAVKTLKVKNTWANRELLLLTDECKDDLCENDGRYYIRAINRNRLHSGNMEILGINCPGNKEELSISVFNKNSPDDKICVSASCHNFVRGEPGKSYNNIKFVRQCFMTKYLSQSL